MTDAEDILSGGGPKLPAVKFANIGDTAKGKVTEVRKTEDRDPAGNIKTWPNGDPRFVYIITLDGKENIWARGQMVNAIREAAKTAGANTLIGCDLAVRYSGDGEQKKAGYSKPKQFVAQVRAPAAAASDDFFQ